jgi:DNA-binding transcriptional MerR regulator
MTKTGILSLGDVARRLQVPAWAIRRLFEKQLLPAPPRMGSWRVFTEEDVPLIQQTLRESGLAASAREVAADRPAKVAAMTGTRH